MTTGWNEVAWNEVVMERSDRNSREIDLVEFLAIFSVVALAVQGLLHLRFSSRAGDMTKFQKIA